jgi:hypothetical protein
LSIGKKQLFYFLRVGWRFGKNKFAVLAAGLWWIRIMHNGIAMIFRRSRKIVNCNEIPIGISAAMDYSRCCVQFLFNSIKCNFVFRFSNTFRSYSIFASRIQ